MFWKSFFNIILFVLLLVRPMVLTGKFL